MKTFEQLIARLFSQNETATMKLGLERMRLLDDCFGNPSRAFESVHIAGTNGKGSVATKIASCLRASGYRVGLYTSPHLFCFRERIQLNGTLISEEETAALLERIYRTLDEKRLDATFFEITTLLAFLFFAEKRVDAAVLETGLGGRLDATNLVDPLLSVITSLSLDHTRLLGETVEKIAREKAGIIKEKRPVLIGPRIPLSLIGPFAEEKKSLLYQVADQNRSYDLENRLVAKEALKLAAPRLLWNGDEEGLAALPPCRLQKIRCTTLGVDLLLDVAHNPDGIRRLFDSIGGKEHCLLFGLSRDKEVEECLKALEPHVEKLFLVTASKERGLPSELLEKKALECGFSKKRLFRRETFEETLLQALSEAKREEKRLICSGSCFMMQALDEFLRSVSLNFQEAKSGSFF